MKTAIVGLGSLGGHLAKRMVSVNLLLNQVITRNRKVGRKIADEIGVSFTDNLNHLEKDTELLILTVPDDAIDEVIQKLPFEPPAIVHTSGSTPIDMLGGKANAYGVLYPLQTFSSDFVPVWEDIPVFVEANRADFEDSLLEIANKIGQAGHSLSSENRIKLHLAAVFACNFSNHLLHISQKMMDDLGIPRSVLNPLIEETFNKARLLGGARAQSGPAKRGDEHTIKKHLDLLSYNQNLQEIYDLLSQSIWQLRYKGKD